MRSLLVAAAGAAVIFTIGLPAHAESLEWTFTNNSSYDAQIDFKVPGLNRWWPGRNRAYTIHQGDDRTVVLNCRDGEKICYGGWVLGNGRIYWGEGPRHNRGCSKCCVICGEGDGPPISLTDGD